MRPLIQRPCWARKTSSPQNDSEGRCPVSEFIPFIALRHPALLPLTEPSGAVACDPAISTIAPVYRNHPEMLPDPPYPRQVGGNNGNSIGFPTQVGLFPDEYGIHVRAREIMVGKKLTCPVALDWGEVKSVVAIPVEEEFDPSNTQWTGPIIKHDHFARFHVQLITCPVHLFQVSPLSLFRLD